MPRPSNKLSEKELFQKIGNRLYKYSKLADENDLANLTNKMILIKALNSDAKQLLKKLDIEREATIVKKINSEYFESEG